MGIKPRQAMQPVNTGLLGPNRQTRTLEWIGADQVDGPHATAILERRFGVSGVGGDRDASPVQRNRVGLERADRVGQDAM